MKARRFLIVTVAALGLSSCNSFNSYQLPGNLYAEQITAQIRANQRLYEAIPSELMPKASFTKLCPLYRQPALPEVPEVPWRQLAATNPKDWKALDEIQTKHIEDLRQWIQDAVSILKLSQEKYIKECSKYGAAP